MGYRASALIVSEDAVKTSQWCAWLEQAGFASFSCPGPRLAWQCLRLHGEPCPRRELADVAVVDVQSFDPIESSGGYAETSCTKLPDDRSTVFVRIPNVGPRGQQEELHLTPPVAPGSLIAAARTAWHRARSSADSHVG